MELFADPNPPALESAGRQAETSRFSVLGIAATALGTLLAVSFMPEDPAPSGALFASALAMAVGLAVAPLAAASYDLKLILRPVHLLPLAPIYWLLLDLIVGTYSLDAIQPEEIEKAFIGIGLFVIAVWAAACLRPWNVPSGILRSVSQAFSANAYFGLTVTTFVLGMLKFAIPTNFNVAEMLYYVGQGRWDTPWARGQLGGWDAFADQLQYFGYLLPTLTVIVAAHVGWNNLRTLFCSGMTIIMAIFLAQSGSRRVTAAMFGMALITWILPQQRLRTRQVLIVAATVVALLLTLEIMLEYRNAGFGVLAERRDYEPILSQQSIHVDDNFYRLCQVIALIPEYYPHTYLDYVVYVIVRPIPRVFWPGKPVDPGFDLASALGLRLVSFSTTVIGELYMAAGFIGIALGGWFYGRLSGMANQLLTHRTTFSALVLYATLTISLFMGVRSMLELVLMNYVTLAWLGLSRLFISRGQNVT